MGSTPANCTIRRILNGCSSWQAIIVTYTWVVEELPGSLCRRITDHVPMYLCTTHQVRVAVAASLLGLRTRLEIGEATTQQGRAHLRKRCAEIRTYVRGLLGRHEERRVRTALRLLHRYEKRIDVAEAQAVASPKG